MSATWNGQCVQSANSAAGQSTSPLLLSFPSNTAAGNLLIVAVAWYGVSAPALSITDAQSNTYTLVGAVQHMDGFSGLALYYCANTVGGANSVTYASTSNIYKVMTILEYPGLASTTLDTSTAATGTSTAIASGNITPAAAGELLIGIGADVGAGSAARYVTNGWTQRPSNYNNSTGQDLYVEDQPTFGTSAISSSFTATLSVGWASIVAAFKNMGPAVSASTTNLISSPRRVFAAPSRLAPRRAPAVIPAAPVTVPLLLPSRRGPYPVYIPLRRSVAGVALLTAPPAIVPVARTRQVTRVVCVRRVGSAVFATVTNAQILASIRRRQYPVYVTLRRNVACAALFAAPLVLRSPPRQVTRSYRSYYARRPAAHALFSSPVNVTQTVLVTSPRKVR